MSIRAALARQTERLLVDRWPHLGAVLFDLAGANREPEMDLLPLLCRRDRLSLDIGAKIGAYTRRLVPLSAHVHAFEPNPRFVAFLRRARSRATVHACALGAVPAVVTLRIPADATGRDHPGRATIAPGNHLEGLRAAHQLPVRCLRLDDLVTDGALGTAPVGFMKIDVEGHEAAVLAGARALLARDLPRLLVEANPRHGGDPAALAAHLATLGYRRFGLRHRRLVPMPASATSTSENFIFLAAGDPVGDRLLPD